MTEKRFTAIPETVSYKDNLTGERLCPKYEKDYYAVLNKMNKLSEENKQLKQDNDNLIHLLENQSMIIQELYSKLMHYQLKEPIVLTKEDLEVMGKAISYYSHRRQIE